MKTLVKVLIVLAVLLVVGVAGAYLARNTIAASVIRSVASSTLGVKVDVTSVDISLGEGSATLTGLEVGNPEGYKQPHIMTIGTTKVVLNTSESNTSKVVVDEVTLNKLGVWFIGKGDTNNVAEISKKLRSDGDGKSSSSGESVEILIKKVVITDINAHYSMDETEGTALPAVPRIELVNVSTKGGVDDITKQLSEKVFDIAIQATFDAVGKQLPGMLSEGVGKSLDAAGVMIGDAAKVIGDGAGKAVEGTGKALGDAAKGIGDIFGGNKK